MLGGELEGLVPDAEAATECVVQGGAVAVA
jgi:hypothetical protein